jgi:hypothetical protein
MYLKIQKTFKDHCKEKNFEEIISFLENQNQIVWSWGAHNYINIENKVLRFSVNGNHHQGYVFIFLHVNELFEIYLTENTGKIKEIVENVSFENLVKILDKKIEYIEEYD